MFNPHIQRESSVPDNTIDGIQQMILQGGNRTQFFIRNRILLYLQENNLIPPDNIVIQFSHSGVYIKLQYYNHNISLILVIHSNRGDPNRIHIKIAQYPNDSIVIAQNHCIWSDDVGGILIDHTYPISPHPEILQYENYFNAMTSSVSQVYFYYISGILNTVFYGGGSKNKKINYKNNSVLELKSICKNKKIKNYSKLNKDGLIKLLKKINK